MDQTSQISQTFRPFALLPSIKIFIFCVLVTVLLLNLVNTSNDFFIPLLLIIWVLGAIIVCYVFFKDHCHTLTLSESEIKYCKGFLLKKETMLPTSKITESSFTQGILERIFGFGTLTIDTPGGADVAVEMKNMRIKDIRTILDFVDKKDG